MTDTETKAFPVESGLYKGSGMSLRDYFAAHAPAPSSDDINYYRRLNKSKNPHNEPHKPALRSSLEIECALRYQWADAMMEARK